MKIIRFDAPNHTVKEIFTILSSIQPTLEFYSYDEIYWLIGVKDVNDEKKSCEFFKAVGFKRVMVVSADAYVEPDSNNKQTDTITLTKYVLVYRMFDNATFCYSSSDPSFKARLNADYIFAPGVYPVPAKDRYGIFSDSHPHVPDDATLMFQIGR